jgi:beta-galactosidase
MWTGFDYLGEARWPAKNSSSGVIDLCGFPKDGYYFYQSQWTSRPMIHLFPHWNWKGREGRVISVMAYTNCDSVELFLNGKSYGIKAMEFPRQGNSGGWNRYALPQVNATTGDLHLSWDIPYAPGVLKAVGRKGGRVVCEEELHTTGGAAAIRLSVEPQGGMGGVAQVRIGIVDKDGRLVPDADNAVQLTVDGGGSLIGYDNGNPTDHTSMKDSRRNVSGGLALAILQFSRNKGAIRVRAESAGLGGAEILVQP